MPETLIDSSFDLPMEGAQEFWKDKILLSPDDFKLLADEAKARAFAVSGITKGDELQTVFKAMQRAIDEGTTFKDFQEECEEVFARRGWNTKNPWRVKTIFQTNIQTAYNVGRYQQLQEEKNIFPYWMYDAINDTATRAEHLAMDGRVYPVDHPVWNSWYPPNGYGCRCSVSGVTGGQVKGRQLEVETEDPTRGAEKVDTTTGEIVQVPPLTPDHGFDFNPGQSWWKKENELIARKLKGYPPKLAKLVKADLAEVLKKEKP